MDPTRSESAAQEKLPQAAGVCLKKTQQAKPPIGPGCLLLSWRMDNSNMIRISNRNCLWRLAFWDTTSSQQTKHPLLLKRLVRAPTSPHFSAKKKHKTHLIVRLHHCPPSGVRPLTPVILLSGAGLQPIPLLFFQHNSKSQSFSISPKTPLLSSCIRRTVPRRFNSLGVICSVC